MSAVESANVGESTATRPFERKMPPVVGLGMSALTLAIIAGVVVVSQIGSPPALVLPTILVIVSLVLELVAIVLLASIRPFAWQRFRQVFLFAFIAYVVQSAIIEWSFVYNDVPTRPLLVLTGGLVVFATVVPLMIAFTVGRYQAV